MKVIEKMVRFAAVVFLSLVSASVWAERVVSVSPADYRKAVDEAVAKGHPRLFASEAAFERLNLDVASKPGVRQTAARRVVERARLLIGKPPLERKMTGFRLLAVSREALYRISTLAMAYRLTGEKAFLDRAATELETVCAFSDWNPRHFLDVSEMSLAVAIGYDWLYSDLSAENRSRIAAGLERNGLRPGLKGGWWVQAKNNWGQVCRAGLIAASIVLADDSRLADDCARLLGESVEALPLSMKAMAPDGCYPEGLGYWQYGVSFNVFAVAILESACGTDFGLCSEPGFMETADYPNLVTGPSGLSMGYSDCKPSRGPLQALWWFAKRLSRPDLLTLKELDEWSQAPKPNFVGWLPPVELFWMDDRKSESTPGRGPLAWSCKGSTPIAILRSGWGADDGFVGIKGGSPNASHGHMDGGNFVFDMGGVRWAWELPSEGYDRIERMKSVSLWNMEQDSGRWTLLRLGTFGHNVPSIDGAQQNVEGFAKVMSVSQSPSPRAELDLTSLYPAAKRVVRSYVLAKDGRTLTVKDIFEGLAAGASVRWQFVHKAMAAPDEARLMLSAAGRELDAVRTGTGASEWKVEPAEGPKPLNSPNPGTSISYFTLKADDAGRAEAEVRFTLRK